MTAQTIVEVLVLLLCEVVEAKLLYFLSRTPKHGKCVKVTMGRNLATESRKSELANRNLLSFLSSFLFTVVLFHFIHGSAAISG